MNGNTKKLAMTGMFCALAYAATAVGRVPIVLFLKYDPKDSIIAVSGLLFGPLTSFAVTVIVSLIEMFTLSENGIPGFFMNVISSCSFACTAASIAGKKRGRTGAVIGLLCGWGCMVLVMMFWNYLLTPLYMGRPREEIAKLLLPAFLPFNLIKGGLNAALTTLLYRPIAAALRLSASDGRASPRSRK